MANQPTILVAEDEMPMLGLLERVLKQQDFRVLAAADGEQALQLYHSNTDAIDAVLLDVGLPKVTGLDVLHELQAHNPAIKVVVVSGYLEPSLKSKLFDAGIKHFLAKPYTLDDVVETLRHAMAER